MLSVIFSRTSNAASLCTRVAREIPRAVIGASFSTSSKVSLSRFDRKCKISMGSHQLSSWGTISKNVVDPTMIHKYKHNFDEAEWAPADTEEMAMEEAILASARHFKKRPVQHGTKPQKPRKETWITRSTDVPKQEHSTIERFFENNQKEHEQFKHTLEDEERALLAGDDEFSKEMAANARYCCWRDGAAPESGTSNTSPVQ